MGTKTGGIPPPASRDLQGWRDAIQQGRLTSFRPEELVCAFQDLGKQDENVHHALAEHLSKVIAKSLHKRVAFTWPDRDELIARTHAEIWKCLLRPKSADGRGLRVAFGWRVDFRLKDAIAKEYRESRVGDDVTSMPSSEIDNGSDQPTVVEISAAEEDGDSISERSELLEVDAAPLWMGSPRQNFRETEERLNVEEILASIPNDQKRLAFRLYMEDVPIDSKSPEAKTIAKAVGRTGRTVQTWIDEVQTVLKNNEGVRHLAATRGGR